MNLPETWCVKIDKENRKRAISILESVFKTILPFYKGGFSYNLALNYVGIGRFKGQLGVLGSPFIGDFSKEFSLEELINIKQ